jgi:exonuclease SbcD
VGDGLDPERNRAALARLFDEVATEARALAPGAPLLVLGHAHVKGAILSPKSERALFGFGPSAREAAEGAGAIDLATFPEGAAYVALGHLHLSQRVGARGQVRYAGSPIPLALAEADYPHAVSIASLGAAGAEVEEVRVPRTVPIVRLVARAGTSDEGPLELAEVLARIAALPSARDVLPARHAWLEIRVLPGAARAPALRAEIEAALDGRAARLVRLAIEEPERASSERRALPELGELDVRDVVRRRYEELRGAPMPPSHEHALEVVLARAVASVEEARAEARDAAVQRGSLA